MGTKTRPYPSMVTGLAGYRSYPMLKGDPIRGIRAPADNRTQFTVTGKPPLSDMVMILFSEEIKEYDRLD